MFNVQQLDIVSLPEIKFDSTDRPHLNELAELHRSHEARFVF